MNRLKIALLFGGCSEEHDVSVKSAKEIADNIDTEKYEPIYIGITRSGVWKMCEKPCVDWDNENCRSAVLSPDKKMHGLLVMRNKGYQIQRIDAVFSVLHGKSGEDGAIQGLFELSGIPYVGCDVQNFSANSSCDIPFFFLNRATFCPKFSIIVYTSFFNN
ncbi:vancomycin/teicoplanin A-type resistance protein VanA [Paenibacillus larvae subsp. larvae]|uniref:Vancomycin/teicoplanin A-type resistance protein VanA n=1 Tax=Paenibacillus larvae subsp. larvae TaxID=147375 RepID=A0A6C0QY89_9BACL|nr:vancomycin/teicoplanin A-type resistance protein VanA [Paenibacillus larvae subsp. larvae]